MSDEYYPDLQGWLSKEEGEELQRLAKGKKVLEIGCWKARSTIIMAQVAEHVVSIDHFRGDNYTGPANTFHEAWDNICRYKLQDKISLVISPFETFCNNLERMDFDFAFYDAGHDYQVTRDALTWMLFLTKQFRPIAVHDYRFNDPTWEPTVKAVKKFADEYDRNIRVVDSLAILEK